MAVTAHYLIDTSAVARLRKEPVRARLQPLLERGLVATCSLLDLEIGRSARTPQDYEQLMADRRQLYGWVPMPEDAFVRALDLQGRLVRAGLHRGVGIPDLLIAVTAVFNDLIVLHYDHDFELIAGVVPIKHEWVVSAGEAD